jgi:O-antigen/teichoic acid export membrane protein
MEESSKNSARILLRNILSNWGGHATNVLVMFFLSPFVVNTLGTVQYGIWSLVNVLTGYMGVLDLGIRASTGRFIVMYIGQEDHEKVNQTIRTSLGFFSLTGIFVILAGAGLGWIFPKVISSVPLEYYPMVKLLLPLMGLNMLLAVFNAVFSSLLIAHDRFDISRSLEMLSLAVRTLGTILALNFECGIIGLALAILVSNIVGLIGVIIAAKKIYPRLASWPFALSSDRMKELFNYGIFAFLTAVANRISGQTDLVVVGWLIDVRSVAVYSIGAMLLYYSSTMMSLVQTSFFPPIQRAVAQNEMGSAKWLFFRQVRLSLICGLPLFVGYMIFGKTFIHIWMVGDKFPESAVGGAAVVMTILSISNVLTLFRNGAESLLNAMGHVRFTAAIGVINAGLNFGLSVFFVVKLNWGIAGVAAGTLVARLLTSNIGLPIYTCRILRIGLLKFLMNTVGYGIACGSIFACICFLVKIIFSKNSNSWMHFAIQVCIAVVLYIPVALYILVPVNDRKKIIAEMRGILHVVC